ncbi:MAG: hypothetical protein COB36_07740 [Alphaproteobacteria bacterium]|nr:MAG: hypothetical protein COB36_07740 [Alphaproteobacteria bacterium]
MRQKHKKYVVFLVNSFVAFIIFILNSAAIFNKLPMILAEIYLFVFLNIHVVIILAFADEIV